MIDKPVYRWEGSANECNSLAIKRLAKLYEKYGADIDDDNANTLYWQLEALCFGVEQAAGVPCNAPSGFTYTREDKLMDEAAREDFARK